VDDTQDIIAWLNSDDSQRWRTMNFVRVQCSVSQMDGQEAGYDGEIAFASLKYDYRGEERFSGSFRACDDEVEISEGEIRELRAEIRRGDDTDGVAANLLHVLEITWDGFRWTPDRDPARV
jgi:hypothetical protein